MSDFLKLISGAKCKRSNNKYIAIINHIWSNSVSRKELAIALNISKVAVSARVEELINWGFVEENGQSVSGSRGRRAIPLALNRDLFYSVGINFTEDFTHICLLNARTEVISEIYLKEKISKAKAKCDFTIEKIKELIKEYKIEYNKVIGVGITLPGITNHEKGTVFYSSIFKNDKNFNVLEHFNTAMDKECCMLNISHLTAYTEHKWGLAKNMSSFVRFLTGFGLGMFLNGNLYCGYQYNGGEIGLMQIDSSGPSSADGRNGTLFEMAHFCKITDKLEGIIANNGKTEVTKYMNDGDKKVTLEMLICAIEAGDQLCAQKLSESFEIISKAIVNLAYIFNVETIFLPKWTARCPKCSVDIVKRMMGHYGVSNWELKTEILSAQCGNEDFTRGAALLPVENIFGNKL